MGQFLANLFFTGPMADSKSLEKIFLNRQKLKDYPNYVFFFNVRTNQKARKKILKPKVPPSTAREAVK